MKHTSLTPSLIIILSISLFSSALAAPLADKSSKFNLSLAPGSIIQFEHLSIEDGLSQNAGLAIFQDSRGFLWVGSQDGLNRYDGYTFQVFKHDPDDPVRSVITAFFPLPRTRMVTYGSGPGAAV